MSRPSFLHGEDAQQALHGTRLYNANVKLTTVALFNSAAISKKKNHGIFLDYLLGASPPGVTLLIDESAYLERAGKDRITVRIAFLNESRNLHRLSASIVNLLDLQVRFARQPGVVRPLSCHIKMRLSRLYFVKNPRNTSVLLRFLPRFGNNAVADPAWP